MPEEVGYIKHEAMGVLKPIRGYGMYEVARKFPVDFCRTVFELSEISDLAHLTWAAERISNWNPESVQSDGKIGLWGFDLEVLRNFGVTDKDIVLGLPIQEQAFLLNVYFALDGVVSCDKDVPAFWPASKSLLAWANEVYGALGYKTWGMIRVNGHSAFAL